MGDQNQIAIIPAEATMPPVPALPAGNKKRQEKIRRRDPKAWENVHKLLNGLPEAEKLNILREKYIELYADNRKATQGTLNLERQFNLVQRERDHMQSELGKTVLAKARLENLCRELQKQNKQIKEENVAKLKEEEERRREVAVKFTDRLNDITQMMEDTNKKSGVMRTENSLMQSKLSQLNDQFKERDGNLSKMAHEMDLQKQLANATVAKLEYELKTERTIWEKERERLEDNLQKSEANCRILQQNMDGLQKHLTMYKNQYSDFESTMSKSNQVFANFKQELTKMSKKISSLEKEVISWKTKWQGSSNTVIHLTELHQNQEIAQRTADKKIEMLQNLCRQLQNDRATFLKLLKTNGIEAKNTTEESEKVETPIVTATSPAPSQKERKPSTNKEVQIEKLKVQLKEFQDNLVKTKQRNAQQQKAAEEAAAAAYLESKIVDCSLGDASSNSGDDVSTARLTCSTPSVVEILQNEGPSPGKNNHLSNKKINQKKQSKIIVLDEESRDSDVVISKATLRDNYDNFTKTEIIPVITLEDSDEVIILSSSNASDEISGDSVINPFIPFLQTARELILSGINEGAASDDVVAMEVVEDEPSNEDVSS